MRLTVAIRKSGTQSSLQKADNSFDASTNQELKTHLNVIVLARPSEDGAQTRKFDPSQLSQVQSRLIEANLRRRNRFLYAQRHSDKLSQIQPPTYTQNPVLGDVKSQVSDKVGIEKGVKLQQNKEATPLHGNTPERGPPKPIVALTATSASAVGSPIDFRMGPSSQASMTAISSTGAKVVYPLPPRTDIGHTLFKCPCCCKSLPVSFAQRHRWRLVYLQNVHLVWHQSNFCQ